ncbi:MAG: septum formation protein Maf [Lachnospiraceae bacterium]|nr:septum formation protein Maf [Lachnospiraceae bacterium]MCR4802644.1 Maf family protein [Lachnospiraceae bacterium]
MYQIILASGSPRRKEILEQAGIVFSVKPSQKEENITTDNPKDLVKELSYMKAMDIAKDAAVNSVVIGADTVVENAGQILGKPKDELEAVSMIMNLQGHAHSVYTGVCIVVKDEIGHIEVRQFAQQTKVMIAEMSKDEAMEYVLTGEPMDKAGAYAIQGKFAKFIDGIEGDYYNVVGFPIASFRKEMKSLGFQL